MTPHDVPGQPGVTLESYDDDRFGFLRLDVSKTELSVQAYTVPRPQEKWNQAPRLRRRAAGLEAAEDPARVLTPRSG